MENPDSFNPQNVNFDYLFDNFRNIQSSSPSSYLNYLSNSTRNEIIPNNDSKDKAISTNSRIYHYICAKLNK